MYSYEERTKAVRLYIKFGFSAAATVRELGYPYRKTLKLWYKEYQERGELHREYTKRPNFNQDQIERAVKHYLEHGRCIARTCRMLGYPSRHTLRDWIEKLAPGHKKTSNSGGRVWKTLAVDEFPTILG